MFKLQKVSVEVTLFGISEEFWLPMVPFGWENIEPWPLGEVWVPLLATDTT